MVTRAHEISPGKFPPPAKHRATRPVLADMKHDPYFKFLAAIIALGVLVALLDPTPPPAAPTMAAVAAPGGR